MTLPLAFLGFGIFEMLLVAVVALLVYGGELPDAMRTLGRAYGRFKDALDEVARPVREEIRNAGSQGTGSVREPLREVRQDLQDAASTLKDAASETRSAVQEAGSDTSPSNDPAPRAGPPPKPPAPPGPLVPETDPDDDEPPTV